MVSKWVTASLAAAWAVTGVLATPAPQATDSSPSSTGSADAAPTDTGDIATDFVSSLIYNATQLDEEAAPANKRTSSSCGQSQSLVVDLGYAKYQGYSNATTGLNYWRGIRYAQAPTGNLRWQPPHLPANQNNTPVTQANGFGPICPQTLPSVPNVPFIPGNEDCLFLNVYAPPNAQNLPVLVWIHGGGYGYGDGTQDMAEIINANNKGFIAVTIQYRLGAFGFLSSAEVKKRGVVNAGILDQALALAWVKQFICQFGGDAASVTISGESAGGGSVMYHDLAVNGSLGTLFFDQSIAASPYLPFQYSYDDAKPTQFYYSFSQAAGCNSSGAVFDCLVGKDTNTLQQANYATTQTATYGYWAFCPVTDNAYIINLASQQLGSKKVNGEKLLVGHNANEGPLFVPPTITTQDDLVGWLHAEFPNLSDAQINSILAQNPNSANTDPNGPRFETDGLSSPWNAVNVSQDANGQQQRANNIYAEATFVCPSYWMASAFSGGQQQQSAWLYQYSVPFAWHTTDVATYFGPQTPNQSEEFALAFQQVWGNFVVSGNPSIRSSVANGASSANPTAVNGAPSWPAWTDNSPKQLNLNSTGGTPYQFTTQWGVTVTQFQQPGLQNAISVVPADTWEGGRGARCAFYKGLAPSIPA